MTLLTRALRALVTGSAGPPPVDRSYLAITVRRLLKFLNPVRKLVCTMGLKMKRHLTALAVCLAIATPASAAPSENLTQHRWMGDLTCGGWRRAPAGFESMQKSLLLNWVLGFLSGRSSVRGDDILLDVEVSSIAAWIDDYCARNPLEYLTQTAFDLERALIARRRSK